jgi:hypothetical protein
MDEREVYIVKGVIMSDLYVVEGDMYEECGGSDSNLLHKY